MIDGLPTKIPQPHAHGFTVVERKIEHIRRDAVRALRGPIFTGRTLDQPVRQCRLSHPPIANQDYLDLRVRQLAVIERSEIVSELPKAIVTCNQLGRNLSPFPSGAEAL